MFTLDHIILAFVTAVMAFVLGTFAYVSMDKKGRLSIDRTMLLMLLIPILSAMAIFAVVIFILS